MGGCSAALSKLPAGQEQGQNDEEASENERFAVEASGHGTPAGDQ